MNAGSDVNHVDTLGYNAANWAAYKGHFQCRDLLLRSEDK